ncbi:hypothetical protein ACHAQA_001160 [Verticillium albo-atrum]
MRTLIQLHIKNDVLPQMCRFHDIVVRMASLSDEDMDPHLWTMYRHERSQFSNLITQSMLLLNLVRDNDDGFDELNACFADFYIKRNGLSDANDYQKTKASRIMSRVHSRCTLAGDVPGSLADTISFFGPGLIDLSQQTLDELAPRYIHKYPGQPPYKWDDQAQQFSGSYGLVRKAVAELTGHTVAVKTIEVLRQRDRDTVIRELGLLEVCNHPNVIKLVDAYETSSDTIDLVMTPWAPFTLMKFISFSDMKLRKACPWFKPGSPISNMIILKIMIGLAEGVEHLHYRSIKHKDLKPDNILLHQETSAKVTPIITDLGVGKIYKHGGPTNYVESTLAFLAPEQLQRCESSLASDIWQLGCCFALLLSKACGGFGATERLWDSYENTLDKRSCNISRHIEDFMLVLCDIASPQKGLLDIVCGMLQMKPADRWDVGTVKAELYRVRDES